MLFDITILGYQNIATPEEILIWGRFHQTFLPSKKLPAHSIWRKIPHSILNQNLVKIRQTPFAKNGIKFVDVDEIDPWSRSYFAFSHCCS
jgi:hypothetical protein